MHCRLHTAEQVAVVNNKTKVSEAQIRRFLALCWTKFVRAKIEPGELLPCLHHHLPADLSFV